MKKVILLFLICMLVVVGLGRTSKADLILRSNDNLGYNLVYDTDLDITWYDFSHFAPEYQDAVIWAEQLSVRVGTTEFTDWRLPSLLEVKDSNSGSLHHSEVEHLYLIELEKYQVLHPWAFPGKWRYFDYLPGGYYWTIQSEDWSGVESYKGMKAPVYNSFDKKLQFVPVSGVNRPKADKHTLFYNKNKYLGIAVHPGDIIKKLQK
ncbi:MAG: hypothetical protein HOI47_15645 [Candidatus Scalindua sp.]|nr:hypothetical protein [Candidatus Scalindua sp.]